MWLRVALVLLLIAASSPLLVLADDETHTYEHGEELPIWVNRVGPKHNPQV
jgi:hypothetical protein